MRKLLSTSGVYGSIGIVITLVFFVLSLGGAQIGSNNPDDATLQAQRNQELATGVIVDVPAPGPPMRPVERVPRKRFGVVGPLPLQKSDLEALVYPSATSEQ